MDGNSSSRRYSWEMCDPYDDEQGRASAGFLILLTAYVFEFLVGAPSNLWLVAHILGKKSKVPGILPADFFPLQLALTQLSFFLVVPLLLANHYLWRSQSVVMIISVMNSTVLGMKPVLLCIVCVERYMAAVRPLDYLRYKSGSYRWGCLSVSWCVFILMAFASFVGRSVITVCAVFLPALVVDTFCSLSVLKALRKPPPGDRTGAEKRKTGGQVASAGKGKQEQRGEREDKVREVGRRGHRDMNSMKRKAFLNIIIIQAVLTLNYFPFIVCLPLLGVVPARDFICQYLCLALAAAASCSYLQPLLYLHRLGRLPFTTSPKHA